MFVYTCACKTTCRLQLKAPVSKVRTQYNKTPTYMYMYWNRGWTVQCLSSWRKATHCIDSIKRARLAWIFPNASISIRHHSCGLFSYILHTFFSQRTHLASLKDTRVDTQILPYISGQIPLLIFFRSDKVKRWEIVEDSLGGILRTSVADQQTNVLKLKKIV